MKIDQPSSAERVGMLKELAVAFKSGDLMAVNAISESLAALVSGKDAADLADEALSRLRDLSASSRDLLDPSKEHAWISRLVSALAKARDARASEGDEGAPGGTPGKKGKGPEGALSAQEPAAGDGQKKGTYRDDYFSNIIEDPKMLAQLCEEVKEHLDAAQFTLVDLEYDSSNHENVNKVFRSFHTIKSSAAFLGMKNLEEVAHQMEDLLVVVRDGKLHISGELADVVFYGIGLLKDIVSIIESSGYDAVKMVESFRHVDIYQYIKLLQKILSGYSTKKIGEILAEEGKLDRYSIGKILEEQKTSSKKFGEIAVEKNYVTEEEFRSALQKQQVTTHKASYVKVSNDRLNGLIDIVGELVVNQSMLRQYMQNSEASAETAERTVAQLESITTSIKNLVLSMGMVPIAEIFNKLRVVVRNTSGDTGKTVVVDFKGEDTELDRNVIETIYDPLVHIVRNAVDHGLENPADREKAGKPRVGKIVISAEHKGNGIEVSVSDDGKGINRDKVLAKAIAMGLTPEEGSADLSDKDVNAFLFLPGFSTADKVTEVSGRGVGLDVVKKNIDQIHGKVEIISEPGKGSRFVVRIPLTLAIIDGFVTMVGQTKYVFPFNLIEEIIVPEEANLSRLESGQLLLRNRGAYVPIIFTSEVLKRAKREVTDTAQARQEESMKAGTLVGNEEALKEIEAQERMLVIVITFEGKTYGIAVNQIIGKQEIVIKSLSEALMGLKVFSGGTIFGDGSIGFVVDIEEFIESARR